MQEYSAISSQFHNLTYPRLRLNDHTLDNLPGFQSQPGGNRLRPPPKTCAGALDALPPELIVKILSQLDLRTLEHFRCVNRRAWNSLTSLPSTKPLSHMRTMPCEAFQASKLVVGLPVVRYMRNCARPNANNATTLAAASIFSLASGFAFYVCHRISYTCRCPAGV